MHKAASSHLHGTTSSQTSRPLLIWWDSGVPLSARGPCHRLLRHWALLLGLWRWLRAREICLVSYALSFLSVSLCFRVLLLWFFCQFFFPFINLFFIASGYHTMFQKQLPIFTVYFPKSSKYLPVLFVTYTPSYREGQKGYFPLWYRRETRAREKPAPLWSPWDRSQEGWIKACEVSCTSRRISLGVIDLFL